MPRMPGHNQNIPGLSPFSDSSGEVSSTHAAEADVTIHHGFGNCRRDPGSPHLGGFFGGGLVPNT